MEMVYVYDGEVFGSVSDNIVWQYRHQSINVYKAALISERRHRRSVSHGEISISVA